jgi:hypothetical protein
MASSRIPGPANPSFRPFRSSTVQLLRHGFPPGSVGMIATGAGERVRVGSRRNCIGEAGITMTGGTVEHSGFPNHPGFFGLVEAKARVDVWFAGKDEPVPKNMVLSYEAKTVSEANWLQFLGPSVVAFTDQGDQRLVGDVTFTKPRSGTTKTVKTALLPIDTPYFLDSEPSSPFASSLDTALCEGLASGMEKISFFDQPIGNIDGAKAALTPFLLTFEKEKGFLPDLLVLVAEFYSYLVVRNTTIYLIRWKAEHEFLVVPETKLLDQNIYRQFVLDDECGPVAGIGNHRAVLEKAFPNEVIN